MNRRLECQIFHKSGASFQNPQLTNMYIHYHHHHVLLSLYRPQSMHVLHGMNPSCEPSF